MELKPAGVVEHRRAQDDESVEASGVVNIQLMQYGQK
jgi:hypothetical protein